MSFGCKYCYARYTHEFMGFDDGRLFEQRIYSKADAAQILREDMRRRPRGAIAIGTSTDPYQPAGCRRSAWTKFLMFHPDGRVSCRRNYSIKAVRLPADRVGELNDFHRRIAADERSQVVLKRLEAEP